MHRRLTALSSIQAYTTAANPVSNPGRLDDGPRVLQVIGKRLIHKRRHTLLQTRCRRLKMVGAVILAMSDVSKKYG